MGAQMGGALENAFLQCLDCALTHVIGLKRLLGLRDLADRFLEGSFLGGAAVQQAGFVEVDVGLDEAGRNEAAVDVDLLTVRDLRIAEVVKQDMQIENGKISAFRVRLNISFRFEDD